MNFMTSGAGYVLLAIFGFTMIVLTVIGSRNETWQTKVGFFSAGRRVSWWLGAFSIAVSWIWAPALFVSVQQAYQQGIPGIFWFTFPNALCLMIMAPLALRIRDRLPQGYTQPEWIKVRFDDKTHKMYLVPFFWYQLMAVTVQLYAGGSIFSVLTGVSIVPTMIIIATFTLIYSVISGMRASILTDFLQYSSIVVGGLVVLPWTVARAGGLKMVLAGLGGVTGAHRSLFDPEVAFNFGIVTTIGLISGMLADQQHWQRAFTIRKEHLWTAYILGGVLFGVVPLSLSLLGFLAANPALGVVLPAGVDPSMIGILVVAKFLPLWAITVFVVMLLCGLCSTLDSGLVAAGSLFAVNCFPTNPLETALRQKEEAGERLSEAERRLSQSIDRVALRRSRIGMVGITAAGFIVALGALYVPGFGLKYLWWIFNTIAACVAVPTVLSLYWDRLDSRGVFWGVLTAFVIGIPAFVYANIENIVWLQVCSSVGILFITLVFAIAMPRSSPFPRTREDVTRDAQGQSVA